MPYTLNFSDPGKNSNIVVPDMPPGVNVSDTSIELVGKGYPSYGQAIAQDFLWLLENFASPQAPQHPIEGQIWYNNSTTTLMVVDAAGNWAPTSGIYTQATDPTIETVSGIKLGDLWVDTGTEQLKIYTNANSWNVVGPSATYLDSSGDPTSLTSGIVTTNIIDNTYHAYPHNVTMIYAAGQVLAIISQDDAFYPNPPVPGFPSIQPGLNLTNTVTPKGNYATVNTVNVTSKNVSISSSLSVDSTATISGVFPAGSIMIYSGSSAPVGWVFCNGAAYSTVLQHPLFEVIGYTYGGSGASFHVPTLTLSGSLRYMIKL